MVNKRMQTLLTQLRQQGILGERLLQAIEAVPRERFADEALNTRSMKIPRCLSVQARLFHSLI